MDELSDEPSPFMTPQEAAAFLRLDQRTLDNMRQRGTGPVYSKHGGRVVYRRNDLIDWSNENRRRTTTEKVPAPTDAPSEAELRDGQDPQT